VSIANAQVRRYASYGTQFSEYYDLIFPRDTVTEAETSWLRAVLPIRGRRVVELGVGNGRVALPLAAAFKTDRTPVEYIGIDISAEMLHGLAQHDVDGLVTLLRLDIAVDGYPTGYESSADYRLLRNFVERRVRELNPDATDLDSFQFAIIRESGYDSEPVEEIFFSRREGLRDAHEVVPPH